MGKTRNLPASFPHSSWEDEPSVLRLEELSRDGILRGGDVGVQAFANAIDELAAGRSLRLSFAGVMAVTVPFARAFLRPLIDARVAIGEDGPSIVATECDPDSVATIDLALHGTARVLLAHDGFAWRLLGAEAQLRETIAAVASIGPCSVAEAGVVLGIGKNAVNRRFQRLIKCGAVERRQPLGWSRGAFQYRLPNPWAAERAAVDVAEAA